MAIPSDLTRFVTVAQTGTEYSVVLKTFPRVEDDKIVFSVSNTTIASDSDKKIAESAAQIFARRNGLSYVPESTDVITVAPCGGDMFMAVKLRSDNLSIGISCSFGPLITSILDALNIKQKTGLDMIMPGWLKLDGSELQYPKWTLSKLNND